MDLFPLTPPSPFILAVLRAASFLALKSFTELSWLGQDSSALPTCAAVCVGQQVSMHQMQEIGVWSTPAVSPNVCRYFYGTVLEIES